MHRVHGKYYKQLVGVAPSDLEIERIAKAFEVLEQHRVDTACLQRLLAADIDLEALEFYLRISGKPLKCISIYFEVMLRIAECSPHSYSLMVKEDDSAPTVIFGLCALPFKTVFKFFKGLYLYAVKKKVFDCRLRSGGCGGCVTA